VSVEAFSLFLSIRYVAKIIIAGAAWKRDGEVRDLVEAAREIWPDWERRENTSTYGLTIWRDGYAPRIRAKKLRTRAAMAR